MAEKKICVLTSSRAEYGLLRPLIKKLHDIADVELAVTGTHLSHEYGYTYNEIKRDKFKVGVKIPTVLSGDTSAETTKTMGLCLIGFADYFYHNKPDMLVLLGDRYETLAVCIAAYNSRIPIAHIHGGETTVGASDEAYRHAITKMSTLHFASTEVYHNRIIQLGEMPDRAFVVGGLGVENALNINLMSKSELSKALGIDLSNPYCSVTYHPETLGDSAAEDTKQLLQAISQMKGINFVFTKSNADEGGRIISRMFDEYAAAHPNAAVFESLGSRKYLSLLKHSNLVLGNSSSGILEAPALKVPVVNIGDRQSGRIKPPWVVDCKPIESDIAAAVKRAMSPDFKKTAKLGENPYGNGNTSQLIADRIAEALKKKIDLKKEFYDINFEV